MRNVRLYIQALRRRHPLFFVALCLLITALVVVSEGCNKLPTPAAPLPKPVVTAPPTAAPTSAPTPIATARPTTPAPAPVSTPTATPTLATLEVPVTLRGASNLGSLQLELRFDPQALELKGVKAGPLARNALVDSKLSAPGRVQIGLVAASGISGDGGVVILTFAPAGKAGPVSLTVEQLQAADTDLRDLVVTTTAGQFGGTGSQATGPVINFRK